jgi:hypothetical protein
MPTVGAWKLRQPEFLFIVPATALLFLDQPAFWLLAACPPARR